MYELTQRQRHNLAERSRREHWARKANNKTYEQWEQEQMNNVHRIMNAIERICGL